MRNAILTAIRPVSLLTLAAFFSVIAIYYATEFTASQAAGKRAPATKRGPATIVLQNGYELPVSAEASRPGGTSRSTALTTADLDQDGFPDLVSGYATEGGGYLLVQRGDSEAFAPTRPENIAAANESRFLEPFRSDAKTIVLPGAPDLIAAGDFDRDGRTDLLTAARGDDKISFAAGDGSAGFAAARSVSVPGRITTLAAGQIDSADGKTDLLVGVESESGFALLIYQSEDGIADAPLQYGLPAAAQAIELAQLDESSWADAAILAGGEVFILHGRDQSAGIESPKRAASRFERIDLPYSVKGMSVGQYIWDRDGRNELALLREDGMVAFIAQGQLDTRPFTVAERRERLRRQQLPADHPDSLARGVTDWKTSPTMAWQAAEELSVMDASAASRAADSAAPVIFNAQLSGQAADDLVVLDRASGQLKVFAVEAPAKNGDEDVSYAGLRSEMALRVGDAPIAAISMRTSLFVRPGLVYLKAGGMAPQIVPSAPSATFTVTKAADTNDGTCSVGDCSLREAHVAANTSGGADMIVVPAGTYTLSIAGNDDGSASGDLDVNEDTTISGAGAATTILQAGTTNSNGIDKVVGFNPLCASVSGTVNNVTIRHGNNTQPDGSIDFSHTGGGLDYCGSGSSTISITNSTFDQNTVNNSYGGGINLDSLAPSTSNQSITNCTISNNDTVNAANAGGGGINIFGDESVVTITGTTISGNRARLTGVDGIGGGVRSRITNGGSVTINNSIISNNNASSSGGGVANTVVSGTQSFSMSNTTVSNNTSNANGAGSLAEGGGFYNSNFGSGAVTITESTFTGNTAVTAPSGGTHVGGGGLAFATGSATVSFSRIVNNVATTGNGLRKDNNAGTITASNNWWGCNTGPSAAPCDIASLQGAPGVLVTTPFLRMTNTAARTTLVQGQSTTITASFLTNSAGTPVAASNLDAIIGLPITFNNPTLGTLSGPQATIQANGTATVTFTANASGVGGKADATVDNATVATSPTITVTNTATWDGSANTDWHNPANWATDFVPVSTNDVVLPAGAIPNEANVLNADAGVATLVINIGRSLQINNDRSLVVSGSMTMSGGNVDSTSTGVLVINSGATLTRTSGAVITPVRLRKDFTGSSTFIFPVGTSSGFSPLTANVAAGSSGSLTVQATNGTAPSTPALNDATTLDRYWTLTETGSLTANLTFQYLAGDVDGNEATYVTIRSTAGSPPIRFSNGAPCPGAGSPCVDTAANTIFAAGVQSFTGFWTAGEPLAPTAADVSVSGRVLTADGRGIANAVVNLTDQSGQTRQALTSPFGYYSFDDVQAGETYIATVRSKRYTFTPRTLNVADQLTGVDFVAGQ